MALNRAFWRDRRVFLTGHTGFKGAWMVAVLRELGAQVHGFALEPPTEPSAFGLLHLETACVHRLGDVREMAAVEAAMREAAPEVVIHMAAQSLVRASYQKPVETYAVNVMGTVHVMEACRRVESVRAAVMVTTDKCYENVDWLWGYRENDRLGGHDPYSNSKAAAELTVAAYRDSFFGEGDVHLASARAGNVIGGGDFAVDRLVPDAMRAFVDGTAFLVRNPLAIRPWQHVLEPVAAYLLLAERLFDERHYAGGWNFGPAVGESSAVGTIADMLVDLWGDGSTWSLDEFSHPHEAATLKLDSTKARLELGWKPKLTLSEALRLTVDWYRQYASGGDLAAVTKRQINEFFDE